MYRQEAGEFGDEDVRLAQAFAEVAAIGILQERTVAVENRRVAQLQTALGTRVVIEQAKGIIHAERGTKSLAWSSSKAVERWRARGKVIAGSEVSTTYGRIERASARRISLRSGVGWTRLEVSVWRRVRGRRG